MTNDEIKDMKAENLVIYQEAIHIPNTYTSREKFLDMIRELRRVSSECSSATPAFMRDTVHHLEDSANKKEITIKEYDLLYRDLVSIGQQFNECVCFKIGRIGNKQKY